MRSRQHPCRCSHEQSAHVHYRRGSDCGICGPEVCQRFRADRRHVPHPVAPPEAPRSAPATAGAA